MSELAELERLARAGADAFEAKQWAQTRGLLEQVAARSRGNIQIWLMLSVACRELADWPAAEQAVDKALATDPQNLRALLLKGDCRDEAGDSRAATRFRDHALKLAEGRRVPPDLASEIVRAREASRAAAKAYRASLEAALTDSNVPRSRRFQQALDLLFGDKQIFHQRPSAFYFPELPQRQFYEREEFTWVASIEAATPAILAELNALLVDREGLRPYLVNDPASPRKEFHGLDDNPNWSTLQLHENGAPVVGLVARAPATYAAMQELPLCRITTRAPTIMFSLLKAGTRIPGHTGMLNTRLICHLPLIVPAGCGFRVGNEVREWRVGELLIFDDTIEHEAWNDSAEDRVVLIFDVWRPELTGDERQAVAAIFDAIDGQPATV